MPPRRNGDPPALLTVSPARPPARPPALPLAGTAAPERADAARNRVRLLDAASRLIAERGAEHVTMEAVAAAASVGKGTVFRRFGDRTGLMLALLDHAEQRYQRSFLSGPPPLGPGAPAAERLRAFGGATLRHEIDNRDLFLAAEQNAAIRYTNGPRMLRRAHVSMLLHEAAAPGDLDLAAEVLLAYLDTAFLNHLHIQRGMSVERLEAGWTDLVGAYLKPGE
ncbi:MAG TPA: helix-turn-helix domain-containing protein [Pseudonocardia sp.]